MDASQRIDSYQVVRELGRGGMGVVLEVRREGDPRRLALKRITGPIDEEGLRRFEREAQLLARISHPGVVRIHSYEVRGPFAPYLVTELIEGEDLVALRGRGALAPERVAALLIGLCEGVEALHAADLIHRDLKPGNVMVRASDGAPVLIDFGLAFDQLAALRLTEDGILLGTPVFMAPEQIASAGRQIDVRTDVYGLGGILFFLLFCRNPYEGEGTAAARAVLEQDPRWPPRERHPGLPDALWSICARAMAKTLSRRYPTPAALREDLQRFLAGDSVGAVRERVVPRAGWGLPLAAAGLVVVLAGALAALPAQGEGPAPGPLGAVSADPAPSGSSPVPGDGERQAAEALERLLLLLDGDPTRERALALSDWLAEHPDHPQAGQARARRERLASRFPQRVWSQGYARVLACGQALLGIRDDGDYERLDPEAARGERLGRLPRPRGADGFTDLCVSADGSRLYAVDVSVVHAIDWARGEAVALPLPRDAGAGIEAACSQNGALLAVRGRAGEEHFLSLLDAATGRAHWTVQPEIEITRVGFSPEGRWVFCFTNDVLGELLSPLLLFDVGNGDAQVLPSQLSQKGNAYAFEPGGRRMAVGDNAGAIHLFDLGALQAPPQLLQSDDIEHSDNPFAWVTRGVHPVVITAVASLRDDGWVLFSACGRRVDETDTNELCAWRIGAGPRARRVHRMTGFSNRYVALETTSDGRWLIATRGGGEIELWDARALARE